MVHRGVSVVTVGWAAGSPFVSILSPLGLTVGVVIVAEGYTAASFVDMAWQHFSFTTPNQNPKQFLLLKKNGRN